MRVLPWCLAAACGCLLFVPTLRGQEQPANQTKPAPRADATAEALHARVQLLHRMRAERRHAQELHAEETAAIGRQIDRLRADLQDAQRRLAEHQEALAALERRKAAATAQLANDREALAALARASAEAARTIAERIEAGIPHDRKARADGFRQTADRLGDGGEGAEAAQRAGAITAFLEAAAQHVVDGARIEVWNGPVDLDGGARRLDAWQLRLGHVGQFFVSEDGRVRGRWSGDARQPWKVETSPDLGRRIDQLVDVGRGRRPPALVPTPFELPGPR
ncbi:MAG TPA: DUF3450 family protein [Planctomycetota bacterium]|nr:DUF3450 family protein [Planctomycetota bacterium]